MKRAKRRMARPLAATNPDRAESIAVSITGWAYAVALRDTSDTLLGRPKDHYFRLSPAGQMRSTSRPTPSA